MTETAGFMERPDGQRLAWRRTAGSGPTVVWIGGWRSDMGGTKAEALATAAREGGWDYLRFDHFAHGASSGAFADATVGRWREDLLAVIDDLTQGPLVLVGSSLGGWLATLAAEARPERLHAVVLVCPAADFPDALMWPRLEDHVREAILRDGAHEAEDFDGPYTLTRAFFDEARAWSLLDRSVAIAAPVRILQGMRDLDVPWAHTMRLVEAIEGDDVMVKLVKDGDHRLARPFDIFRLVRMVGAARG
ncbi:MAG TPA: alpha/beta hydrolase [Caulobacteraceae bacterium]